MFNNDIKEGRSLVITLIGLYFIDYDVRPVFKSIINRPKYLINQSSAVPLLIYYIGLSTNIYKARPVLY